MATIVTDILCDLTQPVKVQYLHGNLFSQDNAANTINVHVHSAGVPESLGGTISANVIRSDGGTVAVAGSVSGDTATVVLPQACYAVPGVIHIIIKSTVSSVVTTIAAVVANVYTSSTDTVVDPGTIITDVAALIDAIEDAVDSIPVDYSGLLATIAEDYSSSKTYPVVGMYAWQGGVLKRNIVPITTAETYTAAHWTNAVLGDDVSDLKSAIEYLSMRTRNIVDVFNANITNLFPNTQAGKLSENGSVRSVIIPVDANLGETLAFYKGVNSRFTVSTFSTTIIEAGTTYVTNTNFGTTETSGTITIDSTIKAVLVWYWYNDSANPNDVLESLTVVYGSTPVSIRSRIPYRDGYATRKIEDTSQDFNSDINLQTGSAYINSNDGPVSNAPLGLTEGAFYITNSSAVAVAGRRAVLQRCYIQSPVYLRTTIWYRFIDAETKTVYVDWNSTNRAWYNPNITIFGDSITAGYPQSSNDSYHWWAYLKRYFEFTNFAQSGAGIIFVNNNKSGTIFADNFDDETQNHLVIFMGTNDYGNDMPLGTVDDPAGTSTVCAGLKYIIETVMSTVPTISIIGILPLNRSDYGTAANNWAYGTANNAGYTLGALCDALKAIYESYGIPVIDNRQSVFQKLNMNALTGDGLHPNVNGYRKLSQHLGGEILRIIAPI